MPREYEAEVFEEFEKYANVVEPWALYDTIAISPTLYGSEQQAGWFTTFNAFGQKETHSFFKQRTEGTVGLPYTNQQSADSMDFAFVAHSVGLAVFSPVPNIEGESFDVQEGVQDNIRRIDALIGHWFAADLPRHMGVQFKIQQDIRVELPAMHCPAGYGISGGGTTFPGITAAAHGDIPFMSAAASQGVPLLSNRYPLPYRIGIPRTATIEGIIHLSEYARYVLTAVLGPRVFWFNSDDGTPPFTFFQKRYMIQLSLIGERMVQQRGQYHR
jgi:hypothetical protein